MMSARMGRPAAALGNLTRLATNRLMANGWYAEGTPLMPVDESSLASAAAVYELLLQSGQGLVRVFPAVPQTPAWARLQFHRLRAEGGLLVSGAWDHGAVFVRVQVSENVEAAPATNISMTVAGWDAPPVAHPSHIAVHRSQSPGVFVIERLAVGQWVVLSQESLPCDRLRLQPQRGDGVHWFGYTRNATVWGW